MAHVAKLGHLFKLLDDEMKQNPMVEMATITLLSRVKNNEKYAKEFCESVERLLPLTQDSISDFAKINAAKRSSIIRSNITSFLEAKPASKILVLGAGFSTYFFETPSSYAKWANLDLPDIINIRNESSLIQKGNAYYYNFPIDLSLDDLTTLSINHSYGKVLEADLVIAEGVLMYLTKEQARKIVALPWKNLIFDVLGFNRNPPLGPFHKWVYEENEWNLNIKDKWNYDGPNRDSWLYFVQNR